MRLLPFPVLVALAAVALAAGAFAASRGADAGAAAPPSPSAAERAAVVRAAVRLVDVRASDLGYRVRLVAARRGIRALTDTGARSIVLAPRRGDPPHAVAHDLAHELGHAVDAELLTPATRRAYLVRRARPGASWWPADAADDYSSGAGDFAEVFALCHAASPRFRSRLAAAPASPCDVLPRVARTPSGEVRR